MTTTATYDRELAICIDTVRKAAQLCRAVQAAMLPRSIEKNDRSPVTVADFGSQALVCATLRESFVDDAVIAEESSAMLRDEKNAHILAQVIDHVRPLRPDVDAQSLFEWIDHGRTREYRQRFFTLDPIDGTKGFLRGGQYAISLALVVEGRVEVGVLGCPNLPMSGLDVEGETDQDAGTIFFAMAGRGAFVQSLRADAMPVPIRVSSKTEISAARFCESVESAHSAHDEAALLAQQLGITAPPLRLDSQAKYSLLSRGEAELYLRLPTRKDYREKLWDHAAGVLVVTEAGGMVTDLDGKPLEFTRGAEFSENRGVLASNGVLHAQVLQALRSLQLESHGDARVDGDKTNTRRIA